jgi:hypothetical protein
LSLSFRAMPSSSSTLTMSVPDANALGYLSGLRPGEKMNVQRGPMFVGATSFTGSATA